MTDKVIVSNQVGSDQVSSGFPAFVDLIKESISLIKEKFIKIIVFHVIILAVMVALIFGAVALGVGSMLPFGLVGAVQSNPDAISAFVDNLPILGLWLSGYFLLLIAVSILFTAIYTAATILLLGTDLSIRELLRGGVRKSGPLVLFMIIQFLLTVGGLGLFVIPGFVISALLGFGAYELVLENKSVMESVRSSVSMFVHNFWQIVLKILALVVVCLVLAAVASSVFSLFGENLGETLDTIFSYLLNLVSMAYVYKLYTYTKANSADAPAVPLKYLVGVSAVGWLVLLGILFLVVVPALRSF